MLNKLNIRGKMLLILATISIAIFIFSYIFFMTIKDVEGYTKIEMSVEKLNNSMLMLRRHEKDFLLRKNLEYKNKFLQEYQHSISIASTLDKQLREFKYTGDEINNYIYNLKLYRLNFLNLTKAIQERGLDENSGLYGSLRTTIHKVQNYAKILNLPSLLSKIYELRKNEKDFMLRKNLIYSQEFIENFKHLDSQNLDNNIKTYLLNYKRDFLNLVNKEILCGLNENLGLKGKMREHVHKTEKLLKTLEKNILNFELNQKTLMFNTMYFIALISIIMVLILILIISNNILSSLNIFKKGLLDFFDYLNSKKHSIFAINLKQNDEFGEMATLINNQIFQTTKFLKLEKEKLDKLANHDQLTGIYNRYKFNELFTTQIYELQRYEKQFSVMLIDIDNFKKINDTYGHAVGDVVLKKFVEITKSSIRNIDVFARWGGEEFVILLPNTKLSNAFIVAEKVRLNIQNYQSDIITSFRISIGVTSANIDDTIDSLINRADIALYDAKATGKNKTVIYESTTTNKIE